MAVFFLGMGLVGIVRPQFIPTLFGVPHSEKLLRNEVSAVYGGFGIFISGMLFALLFDQLGSYRQGILLTVSLALFGMAFGRLLAIAIQRYVHKKIIFFFFLETVLASLCLLPLIFP